MDIIIVFIIILILLTFTTYYKKAEGFQSSQYFSLKPSLWWFVDDEINARRWLDFGARNSHKLNRGYLDVALKALYATQGRDFDIHVLLGREAVSKVLKLEGENVPLEVNQLPTTIWRQWALTNLLAVKGGLVMVGDSTLCVGPSFSPIISNTETAMFGITSDEPRAVPGSESAPASWVGWAVSPHTPVWDIAASTWTTLVKNGPTGWSASEARRMYLTIWESQKLKNPTVIQDADGGRRLDGYERTIEDLLMKTTDPVDPKTALQPNVVYVPMDADTLIRNYRYAWFVRMSEKQIIESDFVWAELARKHHIKLYKRFTFFL